MNRKLTETVDFGSFTKGYSHTYYKTGLKKSFTDPETRTYGYTYNANNQLTGIDIPGQGSITYSAYQWNRPTRVSLPGGSTKEYTYDALMRVKSIRALDPAGNTIMDYTYTYDNVGNILTKTTEHGPYIYGYDDTYQLTSSDNPTLPDEVFTYDPVGNRLTAQSVADDYTYNQNNELLGYDGVTFGYDANGSTTSKTEGGQTIQYIYNTEGRLWQVRNDSGLVAEYYYDPFGRRLWKDVNGERIYFFYTDTGLNAEYDENGNKIKSYGFAPDSLWTTDPVFMEVGGKYYYYQNDHLETPKTITDTAGAVVWSAITYSFGKALLDSGLSIENNLRFPGQFHDDEINFDYNFNRYYNAINGRYISHDPIGIKDNINLYNYAMNSPTLLYDPLGLKPLSDCLKRLLSPYFPGFNLDKIDIHKYIPPFVKGPVEAAAITLNNDIYIRRRYYNLHSCAGIALIAHEITHSVQYSKEGFAVFTKNYIKEYRQNKKRGMSNDDAYRNISYEQEAYALEKIVFDDLIAISEGCDPCP